MTKWRDISEAPKEFSRSDIVEALKRLNEAREGFPQAPGSLVVLAKETVDAIEFGARGYIAPPPIEE